MSRARYKTTALLIAAAVAGCAGSGAGLDANGNPIGPGGSQTLPLIADFQSIQDNVFTPICTKCHIGAGAPEGLQLDEAHSYALLVGVPSTEQPNATRVEPGDPDSSYIIQKLQGSRGISGVQMPFGGPYLPQSTIDVIRQWIMAGAAKAATTALPSATAKSAARFGVSVTSPDNDSIVSMVLPTIVVAFNSDLDTTLLNDTTVILKRTDAADSANSLPISTSTPPGNPAAIVITPRTSLPSGTYRVTLSRTLADLNALALGSDYSFVFTVDASL